MGEAKPFENTTISAPHGALVRVRNRDDGGGDGSEIQRSPSLSGRLRFRPYPEILFLDNGLTEILLEAIHLMHPLVKDRDDADVAI